MTSVIPAPAGRRATVRAMTTHAHDHEHDHDHAHEADGFIFGHEVIGLLARGGGRLPVAELRAAASEAFGADAVYGNCHGDRFDFEGLLGFLSSAGKLSVGEGFASLGHVPACGGH